jgi:hypothetical protein
MFRIARTLALAFCTAVAATAATVAPARAADELPGGKANYVVSLGHLKDGSTHDNWVRLGTYAFDAASGTVSAHMYVWSQAAPKPRVGTGTVPDSSCTTTDPRSTSRVLDCEVKTVEGFTTTPNETRTGVYTLQTDTVDGVSTPTVWISWNHSTAWTEKWAIETGTGLSRLSFLHNTKATLGYGYGSNASLGTRRALSSVQAHDATMRLDGRSWSKDALTVSGGVFQNQAFTTCRTTTWCLTHLQPTSARACQKDSGCPNHGGGTTANISSIQYYIQKLSNTDRRDTLWHWCTCLAMERGEKCYTGNSHVKPMLQVIDDSGAFRGWVGVEASFWPNGGTNPRASDMLSVFRLTDWT